MPASGAKNLLTAHQELLCRGRRLFFRLPDRFNVRARNVWAAAATLGAAAILTRSAREKASADKLSGLCGGLYVQALKSGAIRFACSEQPDGGHNHPRNLFVWRSNLLGSSGKVMSTCSNICWARTAVSGQERLSLKNEWRSAPHVG